MVEDRINHYDLPYEFDAEWDDLAQNPDMMLILPTACEVTAAFLRDLRGTYEGFEELRALKQVVFSAGSDWDVQSTQRAISVQVPEKVSSDLSVDDLLALLKNRV